VHKKPKHKPTLNFTKLCVHIIAHNCHTQHSTEQLW